MQVNNNNNNNNNNYYYTHLEKINNMCCYFNILFTTVDLMNAYSGSFNNLSVIRFFHY